MFSSQKIQTISEGVQPTPTCVIVCMHVNNLIIESIVLPCFDMNLWKEVFHTHSIYQLSQQ